MIPQPGDEGGQTGVIPAPLDAHADSVPAVGGPAVLTVVEGRAFAISDRGGDIRGGVHGFVHTDRRHLSRFVITVDGGPVTPIASSTPTPFEAVVVHRLNNGDGHEAPAILSRRRTVAGALRERIELWATGASSITAHITLSVSADFAHIFDVKAGSADVPAPISAVDGGFDLVATSGEWATQVRWDRPPIRVDGDSVTWEVTASPHERSSLVLTALPVVDGAPILSMGGDDPVADAVAIRDVGGWWHDRPSVTSTDARTVVAVEQALIDLAALQIRDVSHPQRVLVAAGAPWFMTLFGRDSLLTARMSLPFDASLAPGVLLTLAELRGRQYDPVAEEEPGKILHEVRHGAGGEPFTQRSRYFGSVDATPLWLMAVADAWRWGAVDRATLEELSPAVADAVGWIEAQGVPERFVGYARQNERGLANQGWKDSWDGITFADGTLPGPPIALVEVQGYTYAALLAAADLAAELPDAGLDPGDLRQRASDLRDRFNERYWDPRGWFALGLDGSGRPIDALTTNPGHALWCGIAEASLADQYLDRLIEEDLWSGWGLRTLARSMGAYDPLSYHNGSVWPHDTAICAAGAARYGRWDVVDHLVAGVLDATTRFSGRPPELFSGIARRDLPVPISYPASCSPQAWSSASTLLLISTMVGLDVASDGPIVTRPDLAAFEGFVLNGVGAHGRRFDVRIVGGQAVVEPHSGR